MKSQRVHPAVCATVCASPGHCSRRWCRTFLVVIAIHECGGVQPAREPGTADRASGPQADLWASHAEASAKPERTQIPSALFQKQESYEILY